MREDEERYCWRRSNGIGERELREGGGGRKSSDIRHGSVEYQEIYGEHERGHKMIQSNAGRGGGRKDINPGVFYEWAKTGYREKAITHVDIQSVRISMARLFLGVFARSTRDVMLEIDRRTSETYRDRFKD